MASKIWVVQGSTGEYSDHREWLVGYYLTEKEAQQSVTFLEQMSAVAESMKGQDYQYTYYAPASKFMEQFDPYFQQDYIGTNYSAYEVEIGHDFSKVEMTDEKLQMLINVAKKP